MWRQVPGCALGLCAVVLRKYEETDLFPVSTVGVEHLLGILEKEGEGEDLSL